MPEKEESQEDVNWHKPVVGGLYAYLEDLGGRVYYFIVCKVKSKSYKLSRPIGYNNAKPKYAYELSVIMGKTGEKDFNVQPMIISHQVWNRSVRRKR